MIFVKQSTAVTLLIGPFVDSTDGNTAETALTIAQADVRLSKNGGNMAAKNEATSCTHDELGYYTCPLDATDTNTVGILKLMVHETGALPVWQECMVLPAMIYDSIVGGSDRLDVNVTHVADTAQTANDNGADINAILADTNELQTDNIPGTLSTIDGKIDTIDTNVDSVLVDTGTTLDGKLDTIDANVDAILADTNELQADDVPGLIAALNDPTAAAIADAVWDEAATGHTDAGKAGAQMWTDVDAILADTNELQTDDIPGTLTTMDGKLDTIDGIVDNIVADTNELQTDDIPGSLTTIEGKIDTIDANVDSALADTNELQTDWTNGGRLDLILDELTTQGDTNETKLDTIDDFLDTEIAAILEDTGTTLPAAIAALNDLSAADVNGEMVDALNVDTYSEPGQGAPAAAPTIRQMLHYLYKDWRNKKTSDSDSEDLYNDAGDTVDQTRTLSDDGSTFTKGEMGSGA